MLKIESLEFSPILIVPKLLFQELQNEEFSSHHRLLIRRNILIIRLTSWMLVRSRVYPFPLYPNNRTGRHRDHQSLADRLLLPPSWKFDIGAVVPLSELIHEGYAMPDEPSWKDIPQVLQSFTKILAKQVQNQNLPSLFRAATASATPVRPFFYRPETDETLQECYRRNPGIVGECVETSNAPSLDSVRSSTCRVQAASSSHIPCKTGR